MSHSPEHEIQSAMLTHAEQFVRPEASMTELSADVPQDENENRTHENGPLLCHDATYNVCDLISQENDDVLLDKSYGDDSPNEICAFKLDQGKIDELANDYRAETCVSSGRENAIQNESYKETVKSDDTPSRNEDKSRCKSNRKRKTRRRIPEGVIIDLNNGVYGASHSGIKISVFSIHNLIPETKPVDAIPKKHSRSSMRNSNSRRKVMNKFIDNPLLAVFYPENYNKMGEAGKPIKRKRKNYKKKLMDNATHSNVKVTVNAPSQLENTLDECRELYVEDNFQLFHTPDEIPDATECCHYDDARVDTDNMQYPELDTEQTYIGMRKHITNLCCSIFNDKHQEYHICDQEDYNADVSDFNAEMQADWTTEYFHPEYTRTTGCRCPCDSTIEYYPDINMQHNCCLPVPTQEARSFKNSALPKKHQRNQVVRYGSGELPSNIAPEFATEANEYSLRRAERSNLCTSCDGERSSPMCTIRKCTMSRASVFVESGGSVDDLRDFSAVDASRCEIDTHPGKHEGRTTTAAVVRDDDRSNKSDSLKATDTWDAHEDARRDGCVKRRCGSHVVAEPSHSDQSPGEKGGFARGVDSEWKQSSIETDAQQLDYKWKRRIATVDSGTSASVDFKGKRDSRYKSEEAIRVQLRESVKIRKRESLQMVEAMSQTRSDNTNADSKRRETRDYVLWTTLQMGKIWSQVHDACKNVVKLATTSVGRVVKDASKSECLQRNLVEEANATLVESSFSCADKICGETCRKNLMRSNSGRRSEALQERTIGDTGKYCEDTKVSMWKKPRAITPSRHDMRKHVRQNAEKGKDEKSCVFYSDRDIVEFLPQNETCSYDENIYPQSLSGSLTYLEDCAYPEVRNRGGSDGNRDSAKSTEDKQKPVQRCYEEARSARYHRNIIPKKCVCYVKNLMSRMRYITNIQNAVTQHESSLNPDYQTIQANVPDLFGGSSNPNKLESANISSLEDNGQREEHATPEQTRSHVKMETYENAERVAGAQNVKDLMSKAAEIGEATISSMKTNPTVDLSQNDSDKPIASTSKWETLPGSSGKSQENSDPKLPNHTTSTKIRKNPHAASVNKTIAPVSKRKRKNTGRNEPSTMAATTHDNAMNNTQIEQCTMQTAQEGNEKRANVNIPIQIPDAIVTKILSDFFGKKKKRVLMSIILQSESDHDVSDSEIVPTREMESQTLSNDVTSMGTDTFDYTYGRPPDAITATPKTVQCFACNKQNCYEIKYSIDSITLEDALTAEYPETTESKDNFAERKTDTEIPQ